MEDFQAFRDIVFREIVSAAHAVEVGQADAFIAFSASGGDLVRALRAEVVVTLHICAASGAARDDGLAQHEVKHGADAAGHDDADQHPEAHAHCAPRGVLADIADHEHVKGCQGAPRNREVCADADGRAGVMLMRGDDYPEQILRGRECDGRKRHGPAWDEFHLIAEREWFGITD